MALLIREEEVNELLPMAEASDVVGYDMWRMIQDGPQSELNLTERTQPMLLTSSVALWRLWLAQGGVRPAMLAGHSLGEYTALVAAEALTFADALRLVQKRGEFMGTFGEGKMLATPLDLETARQLAEKHYCEVATYNLPEQGFDYAGVGIHL